MNKKTVIIIAAVLTLGVFIFFYNRNKTVQEKVDNILNKDNAMDSAKAKEAIIESTMTEADKEYNSAREKYRTIAGDYPPASWTLNQINIWIEEWSDMNKYLADYATLMASMQLTSKAESNIKNCSSKQEAKILYNNAVEEYKVYKEKYNAFQELTKICKQYSISTADMGITSINNNTLAEINNAITKANELKDKYAIYNRIVNLCNSYGLKTTDLGISSFVKNTKSELQNAETIAKQLQGLKAQYDELLFRCNALGQSITSYIGSNKWYNVSTESYAGHIRNAQTQYESAQYNKGVNLCNQLLANLRDNAKSFYNLATYPGKYDLDTALAKTIADEFTNHNSKSNGALYSGFQAAWDGGEGGKKMPRFLCDSSVGEVFPTFAAYMAFEAKEQRAVSDFMCKRAGWATFKDLYEHSKKPFSD